MASVFPVHIQLQENNAESLLCNAWLIESSKLVVIVCALYGIVSFFTSFASWTRRRLQRPKMAPTSRVASTDCIPISAAMYQPHGLALLSPSVRAGVNEVRLFTRRGVSDGYSPCAGSRTGTLGLLYGDGLGLFEP